jgi:ribosome-associated protein
LSSIAPKRLARRIVRLIWKKKAYDIVLLNLKKISSFTDYFVISTCESDIHARVLADEVISELKGKNIPYQVEGYESARWILIDCYKVILHIFNPELREFYDLERLWGDAPREDFPNGV